MNVVLVDCDTLRPDEVGCYDHPPPGRRIATPDPDAFARQRVRITRADPESLPTLPARRALHSGARTNRLHDGDSRLKGGFIATPGSGPIPEEQHMP